MERDDVGVVRGEGVERDLAALERSLSFVESDLV